MDLIEDQDRYIVQLGARYAIIVEWLIISKACFTNQNSQKPTVQQKGQATTPTTSSIPAEKEPLQGTKDDTTSEANKAITFTGMIREKDKKQATEEILAPKARNGKDSWRAVPSPSIT